MVRRTTGAVTPPKDHLLVDPQGTLGVVRPPPMMISS